MKKKQPKSLMNCLLLIGALMVLTFNSCTADKEDACEDSKATFIKVGIKPNLFVEVAADDGISYPAPDREVTVEVYKEYCSGELSGHGSEIAITDDEGYAEFHYYFWFDMDHRSDKVYLTYTTRQDGTIQDVTQFVFSYMDFIDGEYQDPTGRWYYDMIWESILIVPEE